ncbi:MAG: N-acetylglucosamine-6-phosphate deacetylase, partial [Rhodobacteraceae bacterium]|nr:N-acetylglucosamine-6-phosphate deacetylase [Paracoccaceae bacterium]
MTCGLEVGRDTHPEFVCADRLFPGDGTELRNATIRIAGGRIAEIGSFDPARPPEGALRSPIVAPGFIDIQINGACDVQFNESPGVAAIEAIVRGARRGGTAHVMPTFITAPGRSYAAAIAAMRAAWGMPGVLGLHLEGPFLNPERRGVHEPSSMRPANDDDLELLIGFDAGRLLLTLAPECQPPGTIRRLTEAGVIVFAGHSAATG